MHATGLDNTRHCSIRELWHVLSHYWQIPPLMWPHSCCYGCVGWWQRWWNMLLWWWKWLCGSYTVHNKCEEEDVVPLLLLLCWWKMLLGCLHTVHSENGPQWCLCGSYCYCYCGDGRFYEGGCTVHNAHRTVRMAHSDDSNQELPWVQLHFQQASQSSVEAASPS